MERGEGTGWKNVSEGDELTRVGRRPFPSEGRKERVFFQRHGDKKSKPPSRGIFNCTTPRCFFPFETFPINVPSEVNSIIRECCFSRIWRSSPGGIKSEIAMRVSLHVVDAEVGARFP